MLYFTRAAYQSKGVLLAMATSPSRNETFRGTMLIVFSTLLIDLLGFTVILPLMPSMLEYYGTHDEVQHASSWTL